MNPDFAEALINPEPFALVSPRDLLQSSPDFLLALSVIDLLRTSIGPASIPPALTPVLEDLDEQIIFTTEMVRFGLVNVARLMGEDAKCPTVGRKEMLEAACQQFTKDSVCLSTLLILRDMLRAASSRT